MTQQFSRPSLEVVTTTGVALKCGRNVFTFASDHKVLGSLDIPNDFGNGDTFYFIIFGMPFSGDTIRNHNYSG